MTAAGRRGDVVVVGLGNPILSDDGVGHAVAREVRRRACGVPWVRVVEASVGGLELVELLVGSARAVVVDAIQTPGSTVGTVRRLVPQQLPSAPRSGTFHELDLATGLELGRRLGLDLPGDVVVFALEVADTLSFGERLTPAVEAAVDEAAARVLGELGLPAGARGEPLQRARGAGQSAVGTDRLSRSATTSLTEP